MGPSPELTFIHVRHVLFVHLVLTFLQLKLHLSSTIGIYLSTDIHLVDLYRQLSEMVLAPLFDR
jgi:hypothetical protein